MNYTYLLGIIIIGVGLRFLFRGYAVKSSPRMVTGVAIMLVGASQFFRQHTFIGITILAAGFVLFIVSLFMLKVQYGRVVRPNERRNGNPPAGRE